MVELDRSLSERNAISTATSAERYDVLVLDAWHKQCLAATRSLGRGGLRVVVGDTIAARPAHGLLPVSRSRYRAGQIVLFPDYVSDPAGFGAAILDFVREHPTRVLLPAGDASIAAVTPLRAELAALGCTLALAPDAALGIANDKARTLRLAAQLGIKAPRSIPLETVEDLAVAISELGFPFVLKPTTSWTGNSDQRAVPVAVNDKEEAAAAVGRFFAEGAHLLAQEFIGGKRERVTLFLAKGEVKASCGHVAVRNYPPFGGVSAVRESIRVPDDILDAATRLALAIGIEGPCEAEFRRDASDCPRLMEINARVAGTLGHTVLAGLDLPMLTWQWASGRAVEHGAKARIGVRTRSLAGDLMWLSRNLRWQGRPDSEPVGRSLWLFLSEFFRARHYDHFSWRDPWPAVVEARRLVTVIIGRAR